MSIWTHSSKFSSWNYAVIRKNPLVTCYLHVSWFLVAVAVDGWVEELLEPQTSETQREDETTEAAQLEIIAKCFNIIFFLFIWCCEKYLSAVPKSHNGSEKPAVYSSIMLTRMLLIFLSKQRQM